LIIFFEYKEKNGEKHPEKSCLEPKINLAKNEFMVI